MHLSKSLNRSMWLINSIFLSIVFFSSASVLAEGRKFNHARIFIKIEDEFNSTGEKVHFSERILRRALSRAGFNVLNDKQVTEIKVRDETMYHMDNDAITALAVDLQHDAEYFIRGRSLITSGTQIRQTKLKPRHASLGIDLYMTDSGQVIYSDQFSGSSPHIDETVGGQEALKVAMREGIKGVLHALRAQERSKKNKQYEVVVSNLASYSSLRALQQNLENSTFSVRVVSFNQGVGKLYVSGDTGNSRLADSFTGMKVDNRSFDIIELTNSRIQVRVQ